MSVTGRSRGCCRNCFRGLRQWHALGPQQPDIAFLFHIACQLARFISRAPEQIGAYLTGNPDITNYTDLIPEIQISEVRADVKTAP